MRALIADDDRGTTAILAKTLRRAGLEIDVKHDGNAAWEHLRSSHEPTLAIIDWMMPGLDGPELCRRIRREASHGHTYVILLTGRDSRMDVIAGLDAGADDYIVKPCDLDELRARMNVGLRVLTLQENLSARIAELQIARDELARLASTDTLTGLCSRRRWFELGAAEFSRFRRYGRPLSLLVADLDFFKRVNDTFGHEAGDQVLRRFADVLRLQSRQTDVVGRLGGEEFAVLLPETSGRCAQEVAKRIVEACRDITIDEQEGRVTCSCSIGIAEAIRSDASLEEILRRADQAMYEAKREGRNRWRCTAGMADGSELLIHVPAD
jgi:diguanylate cyclase (GGDEF)-like protein